MKKLVVFNAESSYFFAKDTRFRESIIGATTLFCDSGSLSLVLKALNVPHARINGPDFMEHYLLGHANSKILIIGGTSPAHECIKRTYGLSQAFFFSANVDVNDLSEIFELTRDVKPEMIFVCLGLRKQELVVDAIWKRFKNKDLSRTECYAVGVGAAVDFLGQTKTRSGVVWRRMGLEWLPRLIREPRMAPRVVRSILGCLFAGSVKRNIRKGELRFAEYLHDY
jgi:N-acetylglucosaminyldiphosphoundecaprenol N-acetyl-beta-D-mannosaminyltransferase